MARSGLKVLILEKHYVAGKEKKKVILPPVDINFLCEFSYEEKLDAMSFPEI